MLLKNVRKVLLLPDLGVQVEFRTLSSRDALEVGLKPIILSRPDEGEADRDADDLIERAGEVACQCSVYPKIVRFEIPSKDARPGFISLYDLTALDKMFILENVVNISRGRFYGGNRTAFDPAEYEGLILQQEKICHEIDMIARRYSLSPFEVMRWFNDERVDVLGIISAAEVHEARLKDIAKLKAEKEAIHDQ